ncbi:glutathione peroxidase [Tremella mesenterica]|uniref:Glutathione peroxidase n=1 Tax=Tremella mesenterica TaxID=5217 RepID=A0A4Q1BK38_TREME|nr:glutathione peroxidase [Tremella mesenterica]
MPLLSSLSSMVGFESISPEIRAKSFYDLKATLPGKKELDFSQFKGKVVLIINTASKCGFTPQYTDLESLYKTYHDQGLEVLGFPCDQFAHQEPLDDDGIASFCQVNHGVTFPLMAKSDVNGKNMNEVFAWLKAKMPGVAGTTNIKWNFTKFLIDRKGNVIHRYSPNTKPESFKGDIEKLLSEPAPAA